MKRLAFPALGLALACGTTATSDPGPLGAFYKPSGVAVEAGNLLVASSNFDLQYGLDDGGTVISVNPGVSPAHLVSGVRIASYSGEMAVARAKSGAGADDCGASGLLAESVAVVAARSTQTLFPVAIGANGTLRCDGC